MDRETLLIAVSSFFETESHKLSTDGFGKPVLTVESWERITKSLLLLDLPNPEPFDKIEKFTSPSALVEIDISKTDRLIENVYEFTFTNFYPQIIIRLNLQRSDAVAFWFVVENLPQLKKKLSPYGYYAMKAWINFYFGIIGKYDKETADLITGTARGFMDKMIISIGSDEIYADTDTIFFLNSKNFTNGHSKLESIKSYANYLGLPFEIEHYDGAIFFGKKKYVLFKNMNDVTIRGIRKINFGI